MPVYVVEVETGSCSQGDAMLFDSVWSSQELAEEYCEKFNEMGYLNQGWTYEINPVILDEGS